MDACATRRLAEVLASTTTHDLGADTLTHARRAVLDWFGSALAGSVEAPAKMAQQIAASLGRSDDCTIFSGGRGSGAAAALANGVASHILELDDIHKGSTVHAAAAIIPAALAVAEREHADGNAFLTAVALGYETAFRIGEAVNPSHYRFWHPTGTVATFGAAAAAGALMRLTPDQMTHALGTAGTQAAGLWEFNADGAMSKHLHPGKAAMNGVLSADLARAGFTGASRILEGDRGFFAAMSESHDTSRVTDGLGKVWKIGENGYKLHACCGHTHTAIDVAIGMRAERRWSLDQALAEISTVDVETYGPGYEIVKEMNPCTPYQAKFSMAYCVAAALLEGQVGLEQFASDRFDPAGVCQPAIARLLPRIRVTVASDLTAQYPAAWPTRLTVTLRGRTALVGAAKYPLGNAENPVDTRQLEAKMAALLEPRVGAATTRAAQDAIAALPACADMATLFRHVLDG